VSGSPTYGLSIPFILGVGGWGPVPKLVLWGLRAKLPPEVRRGHVVDQVPFYFSLLFNEINSNTKQILDLGVTKLILYDTRNATMPTVN
jgi:hypothetical protein